ncbi:hypothetical protein QBC47DRAFT_366508 [Echria macrotheca]|uniref:Uncharacterized protein n=1 Tax=Echria macrotheca TaxID=438768 RepID=A0AAJ0BQD5_9PEZI|nr:hypothetical protein QBC47DRAFT_366508 [Echria macrotheca]
MTTILLTVLATVTIKATPPPPTTIFVTRSWPSEPVRVVTATYTAPKLPEDYDLHLLPPFSVAVSPTTTVGTTPTTPSRVYVTAQPFPNGAAPDTPDPLGIRDVPWYYGPGMSTLLNLIAISAVLQLHAGPLSQREISPTKAADTEKDAIPRWLSTRFSRTLTALPLLHILAVAALAGMNRAAVDFLVSYIRMERLLHHQDANWIAQAGQMGPPFTLLTWGLVAAVWRIILCITRLYSACSSDKPSRSGADGVSEKQRRAANQADHTRLLALEGVGILLPCSALSMPLFNKWIWIGFATVESKLGIVIPADYMPAIYWDGMPAGFHALVILGIACTALTCLVMGACALFCLNLEFFERCHYLFERHVFRSPFRRLWKAYWVTMAIFVALCVIQLLCMFVGIRETEWMRQMGEKHGWTVVLISFSLCIPWIPVVVPMFVGYFLVVFLLMPLWYLLRGWLFGANDVRRSSFFIPFTYTPVWEPTQLALVCFGVGIVILSSHQLRQTFSRQPTAPSSSRRMRRR